eukprot:CCRYP_006870-RB/>CCRYP_006870-RB protein AED:0.06 eAED:0.06 QI:134/1/1/1/0.66/0.5/4/537/183
MVDTTPLIPTSSGSESKQGHKIFCCCCDSKRAVQIFNILAIISVVIMMTLLSVNKYADVEVDVNGDPYADQELHELKANYRYYMIAYAVGLGVYLIVLCGASMYSPCLVSIAILYSLFNLANMIYFGVTQGQDEEGWIFGYIVWPIVWEMLYIYPHAVFISEINRGIMTPETYARERHSCCCV